MAARDGGSDQHTVGRTRLGYKATQGNDAVWAMSVVVEMPPTGSRGGQIKVAVNCIHSRPPSGPGHTMGSRRRVCKNGCHRDPVRALGCAQVNPTPEQAAAPVMKGHEARYGCSCAAIYWMLHGPEYLPCGHADGTSDHGQQMCVLLDGDRKASPSDYEVFGHQGQISDPYDHTAGGTVGGD